jgi:predicted NBD/HSP70 family sugar kinase
VAVDVHGAVGAGRRGRVTRRVRSSGTALLRRGPFD